MDDCTGKPLVRLDKRGGQDQSTLFRPPRRGCGNSKTRTTRKLERLWKPALTPDAAGHYFHTRSVHDRLPHSRWQSIRRWISDVGKRFAGIVSCLLSSPTEVRSTHATDDGFWVNRLQHAAPHRNPPASGRCPMAAASRRSIHPRPSTPPPPLAEPSPVRLRPPPASS